MNSGGNVWRFTQCELFLTALPTHFTDDHQPGMDTHTDSELDTLFSLQTGMEVSHRIQDTQTRTYCSVRIIFMGVGIPKVH